MVTTFGLILVGLIIFGIGYFELPNPKSPGYKDWNKDFRDKKAKRGSVICFVGVSIMLASVFLYPFLNIYESKMDSIAQRYEVECGKN